MSTSLEDSVTRLGQRISNVAGAEATQGGQPHRADQDGWLRCSDPEEDAIALNLGSENSQCSREASLFSAN